MPDLDASDILLLGHFQSAVEHLRSRVPKLGRIGHIAKMQLNRADSVQQGASYRAKLPMLILFYVLINHFLEAFWVLKVVFALSAA